MKIQNLQQQIKKTKSATADMKKNITLCNSRHETKQQSATADMNSDREREHFRTVTRNNNRLQWVPFRSGHFIHTFRDSHSCVKCITTYNVHITAYNVLQLILVIHT